MHRSFVAGALAALAFVGASSAPRNARADGPVTPSGKGTVGGTLLGGEVVSITLGAVGVHASWPYYVFTPLGMVGGGVVGYMVDQNNQGTTTASGTTTGMSAEPSMYMLAGGMALVIPALVVALNATAYHPPDGERVEPANNEPSAAPPPPPTTGTAGPSAAVNARDGKKAPQRVARVPHVPLSVFDIYQGKLALGVPALELRPVYSQQEIARYGVSQGTELQVPVFKAMF
jgi:hypothetical protein